MTTAFILLACLIVVGLVLEVIGVAVDMTVAVVCGLLLAMGSVGAIVTLAIVGVAAGAFT